MAERRKIGKVEIERTVFDGGEAIHLLVEGEWLCDLPLAVCRIVWDAADPLHVERYEALLNVMAVAHTYWLHTQHSTDAMEAKDTLADALLPFFPEDPR